MHNNQSWKVSTVFELAAAAESLPGGEETWHNILFVPRQVAGNRMDGCLGIAALSIINEQDQAALEEPAVRLDI